MTHPHLVATQQSWDALSEGNFMAAFDLLSDDLVVDNGPGGGPWRHIEGKEAFFTMAMQFMPFFKGTWHQEARCIYADDLMSIAIAGRRGRRHPGMSSTTRRCTSIASGPMAR
jgi:hypothetical protein